MKEINFLRFSITMMVVLVMSLICSPCRGQQAGIATSTDQVSISYRMYGGGKPLLIINGGPGMNSDGFEGLAVSLSDKFLTILYDQRGTGKSLMDKLDASTITLDLMLADMESLRNALGISRWSILGHSFGGMLASAYSARYPDRVDKLILSSSGGIDLGLLEYFRESLHSQLTEIQRDSVAWWERRIASGDTTHHARLRRGMNLAPAYIRDPKYIPVIAERLTQGNGTINQLMWEDLRRINFNCAGSLGAFDRPVLIIQGKEDIIRPSTVDAAQQAFRHSKVVYMEHCGHYGWLDNPDVYFREIGDFLRG